MSIAMSNPTPPAALLAPVAVTAATLMDAAGDLPAFVRAAFGYAVKISHGSLVAQLPDGRRYRFAGTEPGPEAEIIIHDLGFGRRLLEGGDIGFAEAYIAGEWDTPDLTAFLLLFCVNHDAVATLLPGRPIVKLLQRFRHWLNRNSKSGSRRNIHAHYDIGNAFYRQWLDETMTYSSAIFAPGDNNLASAQTRKYRALAEAGGIRAGESVLEIGCGWGGFAEFAAKEVGCRVTGLTISQEQYDFAKRRIFEAGLNERVEIKLQDYRDERGIYDRIASIEMFEAVGEQFWPSYFAQLRDGCAPEARRRCRSSRSRRGSSRATAPRSTSSAAISSRAACCRRRRGSTNSAAPTGCRACQSASSGWITPAHSTPGGSDSGRSGMISRRSASTSASAGSGNITSPIARRASARRTSTCARSSMRSDVRGAGEPGWLQLAAYGLPALPLALLALPFYVIVPSHYATLGVPIALVGQVLLAVRLFDAFSDPIAGHLSDRTRSRFGRRKLWFAAGVPLTALAAYMVFSPPAGAGWLHLLGWGFLLSLGWTIALVPYSAWGAELSRSYDGRSRVTLVREGFTFVGTLAALLLQYAYSGGETGGTDRALSAFAMVMAVALPLAAVAALALAPEPDDRSRERVPLRDGLRAMMANRPFRRLVAAYLANGLANGLPMTLFILFVGDRLELGPKAGLFLLVYFVAASPGCRSG